MMKGKIFLLLVVSLLGITAKADASAMTTVKELVGFRFALPTTAEAVHVPSIASFTVSFKNVYVKNLEVGIQVGGGCITSGALVEKLGINEISGFFLFREEYLGPGLRFGRENSEDKDYFFALSILFLRKFEVGINTYLTAASSRVVIPWAGINLIF